MDFVKSLMIAALVLKVQNGRMRVIPENIANVDSVGRTPDEDPYRRKIATFKSKFDRELDAETVQLGRIQEGTSDFKVRYESGNPAADENGNVQLPNVDTLIETVDMREAQRSYEVNLKVIKSTRRMLQRNIEILSA
ncbi:flagellar basal body rod protein FlgC [Breoghania sp.]|uniref:flagellar basal body rod protein FlgC n=1 Tax=Breoghania sp. TaxID=2065378 RepID=UPI00262BDF12|nr:flagellar basal body rod protein FlgC [Breoghania sp.]MDJ0932076.1 flagellar basal body rod protein FlgC [Breoghania sp.]